MDWQNKAKAYRDEFIEDLKTFLSIDSVEDMSTAKEEKPFGEGVAEALSFMLERGEADGFKTKHIQGYAGYIEYGEGEEEVGVLVHVDVVPAGDGWTTPPFSPDIRDGRIYARGAIDDKGPAMAAYYALKIVRDSGLPVAKRIRLIIGTDEESGWLCMDKYDELEGIPAVGFSPDGEFPIINAEKGQINAVLVLAGGSDSHGEYGEKNDKWTLVSFASGERYNMVPDEATARVAFPGNCAEEDNFGRLKNDYAYFLCDCKLEGSLNRDGHTLVFSLKGRPAHGSEPYNGLNAGLLLAQFLHQYPFSGKGGDFLQLLAAMLYDDFYGEKLGLACGDEVIGKLTVNPGVLHYSEENGAGVKLNIRYPATVSAQERIGLLRTQVRELGWKVESLRSSNAHYVPEDHPVVRTLQRVYEAQTGEKATLLSVGGATYAKLMKDGVAFGAVFPGKAMTAHERDEYAEIDDLIKAMSIYAQAIYELARP